MDGISISSIVFNDWLWIGLCAALIGMSKAGVKGVAMLTIPIMAIIFGGKASTGIVLPMLLLADLFAVRYYKRDAEWKYIWKLLPASVVGIGVAIVVGYYIDDSLFKTFIGVIVIACIALMIYQEIGGLKASLTDSWLFGAVFGWLGGFTTMIGNAAGPILTIYLLAMRLPKNGFIGTGAWFFLIVNLIKVPFHILVWGTISWQTFLIDLAALPGIALGFWIGVKIIKLIPEREFRYFIIVMTLLAAIRLLY